MDVDARDMPEESKLISNYLGTCGPYYIRVFIDIKEIIEKFRLISNGRGHL